MKSEEKRAIPVTIIGGYLGAGKTTLVNHLLRYANGRRLAILVNEFGDLPIDADLIEAEDEDLISLSGGCVCCSYGDGMMEAFEQLKHMTPPPDQVLLEASGVAIPSSIAGAISLLNDFVLDGTVCLVDAEQIEQQARNKYLSDTIESQIADTDIFVLNKSDLTTKKAADRIKDWLAAKAGQAAIIVAEQAKVEPELLLRDFHRGKPPRNNALDSHLVAHETSLVAANGPTNIKRFSSDLFKQFPNLVRAKGFIQDESGRLITLSIVGRRIDILEAPKNAEQGVVVISLKL